MASVADVLFGNKKPRVDNYNKSSLHQEKKYVNCEENRKRQLSQDKINQLLGKKPVQVKKPIKTENNYKNNSNDKSKKEITIKNSNLTNLNKPSLIRREDSKNPSDRERKPPISKINSKEEKLYKSLKEFKNINEVFEEMEKNKEYDKMFKEKAKSMQDQEKEREKLSKSQEYKPANVVEDKMFKVIDEINKIKEAEDYKMLGKKHKLSNSNSSGFNKSMNLSNFNYSDKDVWCSKCKKLHASDFHKLPSNVDMKKVFGGEKLEKAHKSEPSSNIYQNKSVESNFKKSVSSITPIEKSIERIKSKITPMESNKRVIEKEERLIKSPPHIKSNTTGSLIIKSNSQIQSLAQQQNVPQISNNNFYKSPVSVNKIPSQSSQANNSTPINQNFKPSQRTISIEDKISKLKNKPSENTLKEKDYKERRENREHREHKEYKENPISSYYPEKVHYKKSIHPSEKIPIRPKSKSNNKDALFSREDFEEEDDFIVDDDDDTEDYRRHLQKINSRLMRRSYYQNERYDDYSDGDLEEAGFDEIQDEEEKTARIGAHEDWIEEMREKEMMERKRRKYD
jgi:hypothetical protein